jgi:hypothetical protein
MTEERLLQCVKELARRVEQYGSHLQRSEIQTRYTLIDPLLRALGWNIEDPAEVCLDHDLALFRPYAIFYGGKVCLVIKARPLGSDLTEVGDERASLWNETPYFAMTDGRHWEVYATHGLAIPENELIVKFDICSSPVEVVPLASVLRPSVLGSAGPPVPVFPLPKAIDADQVDGEKGVVVLPDTLYLPKDREGVLTCWVEVPVETWKDFCVEIVRWLVDVGKLGPSHCPIQRTRNKYIVHTEPRHPSGAHFPPSQCTQVGSVWVDTKYNRKYIVENTELILRHVGEDPHRYGFRWGEKTYRSKTVFGIVRVSRKDD